MYGHKQLTNSGVLSKETTANVRIFEAGMALNSFNYSKCSRLWDRCGHKQLTNSGVLSKETTVNVCIFEKCMAINSFVYSECSRLWDRCGHKQLINSGVLSEETAANVRVFEAGMGINSLVKWKNKDKFEHLTRKRWTSKTVTISTFRSKHYITVNV